MLLEKLTNAIGISGNEKIVRNMILEEIKDHVNEVRVDRMGNVIAFKKGLQSSHHVALAAHMDEVGLMVKGIDPSGLVRFTPIGGVDARILVSKRVLIGAQNISGVIGAKAIHMQKPDERTKALTIDDLYIDLGCRDQKDAETHVSIGDYIAFDSTYTEFGKNRIKAKALDDRVGCYLIIELLKQTHNIDMTAIFTVQEEIGLRGAEVAANQVDAELAIVLEGTTCSDVSDVDPHLQVTELDKGPAISIMDRTSIYQRKWLDALIQTADENEIPWQYRKTAFGGNDAGKFHLANTGTPCVSMAVPCRYIHSPVSVLSKDDVNNAKKLLVKYLEKLGKGGLL